MNKYNSYASIQDEAQFIEVVDQETVDDAREKCKVSYYSPYGVSFFSLGLFEMVKCEYAHEEGGTFERMWIVYPESKIDELDREKRKEYQRLENIRLADVSKQVEDLKVKAAKKLLKDKGYKVTQ